MPSKMTMDFAGVEASASFTNPGQVGDFGLIFSGAGDQLFLSTAGDRGPIFEFRRRRSSETVRSGVGGDDR